MNLNTLAWYVEPKGNWGDDLNPYLYHKITGIHPTHVPVESNITKYLMIGSILDICTSKSIIWGTGSMFPRTNISSGVDIKAVRGPLSRNAVLSANVKCPDIYGDPALLISQYYHPNIPKQYKLGIIPHYIDESHTALRKKYNDSIIIDIRGEIESVINKALSCERIISSSLHGIILCDSYNIPNMWVEFSKNVVGCGFKFHDYLLSIGVTPYTPLNLISNTTLDIYDIYDNINQYDVNIDLTRLMDVCPFN